MRPLSIVLEGFSAYRRSTSVDFREIDFLSLSGPTGAGKSSLIDAMIFALYGRVPRLGGVAVAPLISAGSDRARVALQFEVGDEAYTAVRQVVRTKGGGATTNEARLESGEVTLASGADEVTRAVEDLLRLRYDDFTKTVVLPQGEFARFLSATKADRQALLRKLLGLDVYTFLRQAAERRREVAADKAKQSTNRREAMDLPDEATLASARARTSMLEEMVDAVAVRQADLDRYAAEAAGAEATVSKLLADLSRLDDIEPPPDLEALSTMANQARDAHHDLEARREAVLTQIEAGAVEVADLPSADALEAASRLHERLAAAESRLSELADDGIEAEVDRLSSEMEAASAAHQAASAGLDQGRVVHAAHGLRASLVIGQPCPVCEAPVSVVGESPQVADLERLTLTEKQALASVNAVRDALADARANHARVSATRLEVEAARATLIDELEGLPGPEELAELVSRVERATAVLRERQEELATIDRELVDSQRELERAAEAYRSIGRRLIEARDVVSDLKPPLPESDDDVVRWKELMAWVTQAKVDVESSLVAAREQVAEHTAALAVEQAALVSDLERAGVDPRPPFAVQVAREHEQSKQRVREMEAAITHASELDAEIALWEEEAAVARSLAGHLRADGFERWLMAGAVAGLVSAANQLLSELSGGGYSLDADDEGGLAIIDHRNADETRPVATLSGGETFLVSLALALALAETLSAGSESRLDAIFLDEGFGTLDEESLDTVAAVLEELAGSGLMVGIITHVKELAARASVRFEISKGPDTSSIERVVA